MSIKASVVRDLREQTGAGMMECKKALVETNGDMQMAIDLMRKKGVASAEKKASRITAEGSIAIAQLGNKASIVEVNCETDFVTKGDDFTGFVSQVAKLALDSGQTDVEQLKELMFEGSVEEARQAIVAKVGENINVRRISVVEADGVLGVYQHGSRIAVLVSIDGSNDKQVAKDVAMHVAASNPLSVQASDLPKHILDKEKEIFTAQAKDSGKPAEIVEKMVEGRIKKFVKEKTLLTQPFIKDPDMAVQDLLAKYSATVNRFIRFEVGEGIEKRQGNFAEEVAAQVSGKA